MQLLKRFAWPVFWTLFGLWFIVWGAVELATGESGVWAYLRVVVGLLGLLSAARYWQRAQHPEEA
jgi:uncharacterized membrane protein